MYNNFKTHLSCASLLFVATSCSLAPAIPAATEAVIESDAETVIETLAEEAVEWEYKRLTSPSKPKSTAAVPAATK